MGVVCIQRGHCFRARGATGTAGRILSEQQMVDRIAQATKYLVDLKGLHTVHVLLADEPVPPCDVFLAFHCDGATSPRAHGASIGYPARTTAASRAYGDVWKGLHQFAGYLWGFRPDNYTAALRNYYGYRKTNAGVVVLMEHGFLTTPDEEDWMVDNVAAMASAHAVAIDRHFGTLNQPPAPPTDTEDDDMVALIYRCEDPGHPNHGQAFLYPTGDAPGGEVLTYWVAQGTADGKRYVQNVTSGSVWLQMLGDLLSPGRT